LEYNEISCGKNLPGNISKGCQVGFSSQPRLISSVPLMMLRRWHVRALWFQPGWVKPILQPWVQSTKALGDGLLLSFFAAFIAALG
jgi:hypothetical protein